jgi:cleavage and polyadenylation specificity factor subunit 4
MLREAVSSVEDYEFEMEDQLEKQTGTIPLPFPKMDKNKAALCEFYLNGVCSRGSHCPFRHMRGERTVVCKHWMRHLCKKGDDCEFLHEYEMSKMPVCYFFQRFGECTNKDCQYLHVDAETLKIRDCAWYDRGFCKHGPSCRNRHTRRVLCQNYLCGFCPDGPKCKYNHAKFDIPVTNTTGTTSNIQLSDSNQARLAKPYVSMTVKRPLETVTCFKCGEKGHYANTCPKSFRAQQMGLVGTQQQIAANVGVK